MESSTNTQRMQPQIQTIIQPINNNSQQLPPNQTLYVNNLNESIKLDELKLNLFHLFSQFGDVIEINSRKSKKMKGQAFIVFKDITSATNAKVSLNNTLFLGETLHIAFARNVNDTLLKLTGNISMKDKTLKDIERKKRREEEYKVIESKIELNRKRNRSPDNTIDLHSNININGKSNTIKSRTTNDNSSFTNNVLFVEGLPREVNENVLKAIFGKYNGFKEIRLLSGRMICFVEFDNEMNAGSALVGLNGYKLTNDCVLVISFAKK